MTRRDYVMLSDALRLAREGAQSFPRRLGVDDAARMIANVLSERSAKFDADRFLRDARVTQ